MFSLFEMITVNIKYNLKQYKWSRESFQNKMHKEHSS